MAKSSTTEASHHYDDLTSSLPIPGLFNDFYLPAKLLRLAKSRNELPTDIVFEDSAAGAVIINNFYNLLDKVEAHLNDSSSQLHWDIIQHKKFIIEVEGLDGSGKTTLVKRLAETLPNAIATKTPSASLHDIRPLWDKCGGILARAFYMISNYVLEYEIANYYQEDVVIIDRWFASTCGYTVARPPNGNYDKRQIQPIADMPNEIFDWPADLRLRPNILLVLQIDQAGRQKRVEQRAQINGEGASRFNPWDERLAKDVALGERILEALHRVRGPIETCCVNANNSIEDVARQALEFVQLPMEKQLRPEVHFGQNPLQWWMHMAQNLNCCDDDGKRKHHALWNLQVAYNNNVNGPIPTLKTVGLDRIDDNFVYYWTASAAFPRNENLWGSILWEGGSYPTEFQWRAEGYLRRVTREECALRGYSAPPSLVAHVSACDKFTNDNNGSRMTRPEIYDEAVKDAREVENDTSCVCMIRFVPIRIEVLRGGPSSRLSGYPQRWEWSRNSEDVSDGWTMRSILPFGPTPKIALKFRPMTICIIGTHTSGKSTIGRKLAKILGCQFDGELGEIERDKESLVEGGHLHGDGSSSTASTQGSEDWDDFLLKKECERDAAFSSSTSSIRVVETWHVGNAAWYKLRKAENADLERYKSAIAKHQETSLVVVVQLMLKSPSTMVQRREVDSDNKKRLPMKDDEQECNQLYNALQENDLKEDILDQLGIPLVRKDNDDDGEDAMEKALIDTLAFVQKHLRQVQKGQVQNLSSD